MAKRKNNKKNTGDIGCPEIRKFAIGQLRPADYNPRTVSDEALAGLSASLKRFGCVEPIVVNVRGGKNTIVGGNQRFKVLQAAGAVECLCVTVDCDPGEEKTLNLALNNPVIQGEFIEKLDEYIVRLQDEFPDEQLLLDLKINQLRADLEFSQNSELSWKSTKEK